MSKQPKTALITGASGQDGLYLTELLLSREYRVIGAVRNPESTLRALPDHLRDMLQLVRWDMQDAGLMRRTLETHAVDEFYNLAAYSSGSGMYDDPVGIGEVNGLGVARILEAIRLVNPATRFCQASSREIFGEACTSPQTEATPLQPRSPYGAAKLYADTMIRIGRQHFGLHASSAIFFNHESPRRGLGFVTRKITHAAARIKLGLSQDLPLGNLETQRDWGFAGDYVRAMWLMLQQTQADDYVVATGVGHTVRDFCRVAFEHVGLDYGDFVFEAQAEFRPAEPTPLVGDAGKARRALDWAPVVDFEELVHMMVDADLHLLSENI